MKKSKLALSKMFPIGSARREIISKVYRKFRPRSESEIIRQGFLIGAKAFDESKETIVLVSHQSSATGAPLLGLNIGKSLSEKFNLIHYVMDKAEIHDSFKEDGVLLVEELGESTKNTSLKILKEITKDFSIKAVIGNSVTTYSVLSSASDLRLPTLSLIHEFAGYVESAKIMLDTIIEADRVIVPAKIIKDSIMDQLAKAAMIFNEPSNIVIQPQGKLPYIPSSYGSPDDVQQILKKIDVQNKNDYKIIVAAGSVHIRKGVDLFIYLSRYIKKYYDGKCKFVWVGGGLKESDCSFSFLLKREVKSLGLEDDFVFLGHQQNLDSILSIADMFCLTSRMDPFPNVVVDALEADVPIACFSGASGSVEFLEKHNAEAIIVDYLDTHKLGYEIANYLKKPEESNNYNSQIVKHHLDFDKYIDFLIEQISICEKYNSENSTILANIENSKYFDREYIKLSELENNYEFCYVQSAYHYILSQRKGLYRLTPNPCAGFSTYKWALENNSYDKVPLYEAIKNNVHSTHECHKLPLNLNKSYKGKFAVHLHLYYVDLAQEFNDYFKNLPAGYDLYITTVGNKDILNIKDLFKDSGASNIEVITVDNIGRDIGPMVFGLKDLILGCKYDVIGHFHSKKSVSVANSLGDRWRKYLLDNLVGDECVASSVLGLFEDKKVGLVFAEDRHFMDMGDSKSYIDELSIMLNLPEVYETPLFPLGNMFWARVDAIKDIFDLDESQIIQEEPLPYDGSYMHALERITPALVNKNGYKYVTVYKDGTSW
ncbi:rhamnan synthesis F family protein [Francisella sp. 19X1-34]|uniref:rhamnan synthesis F family protein n=1 Tax=Francisella sp. 19X1-34 TaxID=3087177 RepID=UPI002E341339|nr:rhamnan synthesis F family protein [Francisella sp. 19X1-34]MED7787518.1 rhamnan synthesis F family protein [Francisella sp. 19X1-34]